MAHRNSTTSLTAANIGVCMSLIAVAAKLIDFCKAVDLAMSLSRPRGSSSYWLLALGAFFACNACPALTWRWSNPVPHGNNIVDMVSDGQQAVQVTELGQIYTGPDFRGWQPRVSG